MQSDVKWCADFESEVRLAWNCLFWYVVAILGFQEIQKRFPMKTTEATYVCTTPSFFLVPGRQKEVMEGIAARARRTGSGPEGRRSHSRDAAIVPDDGQRQRMWAAKLSDVRVWFSFNLGVRDNVPNRAREKRCWKKGSRRSNSSESGKDATGSSSPNMIIIDQSLVRNDLGTV